MTSSETLELMRSQASDLYRHFGIRNLFVFGSVARDEARFDSDVDVLVEFEGKADFDRYMGLKLYLEDMLHRRVDLVTRQALRPALLPFVEKDAIRVP